jgi:putative hydrolase of the HAD superfamily
MLNQPVALDALDGVILDFGGVLYDIDYDAPPRAFAALGDPDFASLYHQASQSSWFDDLETGTLDRDTFYGHLRARCAPGTTVEEVHAAWCCILTGMPAERAELVVHLGARTRLFLLSNTNAIHARVFEEDLRTTLPDAEAFWASFEAAHYSQELGMKKPHPETFLHVCQLHGLAPERTLFLDDSEQHVRGADQAGLHAHHLDLSKEDLAGWLTRMGWPMPA